MDCSFILFFSFEGKGALRVLPPSTFILHRKYSLHSYRRCSARLRRPQGLGHPRPPRLPLTALTKAGGGCGSAPPRTGGAGGGSLPPRAAGGSGSPTTPPASTGVRVAVRERQQGLRVSLRLGLPVNGGDTFSSPEEVYRKQRADSIVLLATLG